MNYYEIVLEKTAEQVVSNANLHFESYRMKGLPLNLPLFNELHKRLNPANLHLIDCRKRSLLKKNPMQ